MPDFNTVIEIQGTYWQADRRFYNRIQLKGVQKSKVIRDRQKKTLITKRLDYDFIELWEYDLKNHPKQLKVQLENIKIKNEQTVKRST